MRILICFRSKGKSNSIVSSTLTKEMFLKQRGIKIETLNLDKLNIYKYLDKKKIAGELPKIVYFYEDKGVKEIELVNRINRVYKDITTRIYDYNCIIKRTNYFGGIRRVYTLYSQIINDCRNIGSETDDVNLAKDKYKEMVEDNKDKESVINYLRWLSDSHTSNIRNLQMEIKSKQEKIERLKGKRDEIDIKLESLK